MRILLMDDDPTIRDVARQILERSGYRIRTVANGESAVAAFREAREAGESYGCVILDLIVRNGMGGEETIGKLRSIDPCISAILISGSAAHPAFQDFAASGFDVALGKPFSGEQLLQAVHQFVGKPFRTADRGSA